MLRGIEKWGWGYLRQRLRMLGQPKPRHLLFCVADHFEPFCRQIDTDGRVGGGLDVDTALQRVLHWCKDYRSTIAGIEDDSGRRPQHTFFYPWDEYDPKVLDAVGLFCRQGFGEVEVHLHHRADTVDGLYERLTQCRETYAREHGLLGRYENGDAGYAFVHGNWALCNSRADGDWCGVSCEVTVLRQTGCYMDCTFPSAPSPTQPRYVNRLYYGGDPPEGKRGHQFLSAVRAGESAPAEGLLMLPGPLGIHKRRHARWHLGLENGEMTTVHPASWERYCCWRRLQVHVAGVPDWLFVKLHTHGLDAASRGGVLGEMTRSFYAQLRDWCHADGMQLHYVTAREMYNVAKAAEAGKAGNPVEWRDMVVGAPP